MNNDTSAILVSIEKLESSLENMTGTSASPSISTDALVAAFESSIKPTLETIHDTINKTQESQNKLQNILQNGFENVETIVVNGASNVTDAISARIDTFETKMAESQKLIQDQVNDAAD